MGLNPVKGNMYDFISHTYNVILGRCPVSCAYCYMKKLCGDRLKDPHFEEKELQVGLGTGNFIFVGSSIDAWAQTIPRDWISRMLDHCNRYENRYLFQSKNPERFLEFSDHPVYKKSVFCTTIESNRVYTEMANAPEPRNRAEAMAKLAREGFDTYVTAEPIMDFDYPEMLELLLMCKPKQVNIGKNTNHQIELVEPIAQKILTLGNQLRAEGIKVEYKKNIRKYLSSF